MIRFVYFIIVILIMFSCSKNNELIIDEANKHIYFNDVSEVFYNSSTDTLEGPDLSRYTLSNSDKTTKNELILKLQDIRN